MNKAAPVGTLPQTVRRDFSAVGYDEAMQRARDIVPILRERAPKGEDARMLIRENEQLLHESGLFRFHQPKAAITGSSAIMIPRPSTRCGTRLRTR
jgi:hypothetical protein